VRNDGTGQLFLNCRAKRNLAQTIGAMRSESRRKRTVAALLAQTRCRVPAVVGLLLGKERPGPSEPLQVAKMPRKMHQARLVSRHRTWGADVLENLRVIRVFIGSPGGLDEERQAAHAVVKEINQHNSDHWGSMFKLMGWEEAIPGYRRAQDKINDDLDRCDYFIGVMWDKWGSKPSVDPNGATSGFEEEYLRAAARIESGLMRDMAIFFKKVDVPPGMEPGAEIKKVLVFRQKCIDEKKVFFRDFIAVESFKDAVRAKLMEIGWLEYDSRKSSRGELEQEDQPPRAETETEITFPTSSRLIGAQAQEFVSEMLQRPADWDAVEPCEIARFRLISASITRSGNDEVHLGTHDANLMFRHFRDENLSDQELMALIDCGVVGFMHQNVPLWRWIAKADMGTNHFYRLRILATVGSDDEKIGAIRVLQRLSRPLPTHDGYFNKAGVLTDWLSNDTAPRVFDAVVSFLSSNGLEDEISLIEQASTELPPYKKPRVDAAIVEIISRRSFEDALVHVCAYNVSSIEAELAQRLLSNSHSLTTGTLKLCLSAKPDAVRVGAAKVLYARGEIDEDSANNLLTDDNAEMRLIAAEVLRGAGKELADDVLEKLLKVQKAGGLGVFGSTSGGPDTAQLVIYRANRRAELSASKLLEMAEGNFLEYECLGTLFERHSGKVCARIRDDLNSNFAEYFEKSAAGFRDGHSSDNAALRLLNDLIPSFRKELFNIATHALCKLGRSEDLELIRWCVDTQPLKADESIFQFLSRFGDWKDVERILNLGRDEIERRSILSIDIASFPRERAAALVSIGKNRIADLLALEIDATIRRSILKQVPRSTFASLPDQLILRELAHPSSECRAIVAMRCVQILPKGRVSALLDSYIDNADYRFYNSIHWLDLGVAMPSKQSKAVVERELSGI